MQTLMHSYIVRNVEDQSVYAVVQMSNGDTFGLNVPAQVSADELDALVAQAIERRLRAASAPPAILGERRHVATPDHVAIKAEAKAIAADPNTPVRRQISALEAAQPVTQRALRELMLAIGQAFPAAQASVFYSKAAQQEAAVAALRAKLK